MMRDYAIGEEGKRAGLAAKQRVAESELDQIEGEKERSGKLSEAKIKAEADIEQEKIKASSKEPKRTQLDDRRDQVAEARARGFDMDPRTEGYFLLTGELPKPPKDGKDDDKDAAPAKPAQDAMHQLAQSGDGLQAKIGGLEGAFSKVTTVAGGFLLQVKQSQREHGRLQAPGTVQEGSPPILCLPGGVGKSPVPSAAPSA